MKGELNFSKEEALELIQDYVPFGDVVVTDMSLNVYSDTAFLTVEFTKKDPPKEQPPANYLPLYEEPATAPAVAPQSEDDHIPF